MSKMKLILSLYLLTLVYEASHVYATRGTFEKELRDKLLGGDYDKTVRPVKDHNKPLNVSFGLRLSKLVELDTKNQLLVVDVWIVQSWNNPFLSWNESEHGGIHTLHIQPETMWVPDTVLYDNGDEDVSQAGFLEKFKTYVMLNSNGTCTWMAPATFKSSCEMDLTNFPFDTQACDMTFGSWTYDSRLIRMQQLHETHELAEKFITNGDWRLQEVEIKNRLMTYTCCPHPFSDVTYTFTLDRKPNYHILNLVVPCVILAFISLISFYLPPDCGERIGLSITVLLALSVYLLIISDKLPETSDYVPRLGLYYMCLMGELALALAATAVSIKCHHSRTKPPKILMRLIRPKQVKVRSISVRSAIDEESEENHKNQSAQNGGVVKQNEERNEEENKETWCENWMDISLCLDRFFLVTFTVLFAATTFGTLFSRN
ncbi:neuronal acetylcholine receptor subunit alpha-9-like [Actinia tenebrosa]|uniref:Neuronal acetylcholine receptor subunit alpha-9-like n=1 Tax=Actinia tenebrosa TaxID=6105 RepID=A0A6P8I0A6_ACTTE|nr:neuronal acetylcholine receptor subunit alpha-9-like [Actinia tenebrosa]